MIEYSGEEKMIAFRTRLITGTVTRTDVELKQQQQKKNTSKQQSYIKPEEKLRNCV